MLSSRFAFQAIGANLPRLPLTHLPAVIAFAVIVLAWFFVELQNERVFQQGLQTRALNQLSLVRAKLEGNINGNIQLVRGLVATVSTEPDMDQVRYDELASALLQNSSQLHSIAAAPGLVIEFTHPLAGNESAIGLDYTANADQREAALRARDSGEMVFAGPVDLVQGGQGFIARFPVFVSQNGTDHFWGVISAVIDVESLYADSGLYDANLPLEIAISGRDGQRDNTEVFFGTPEIFQNNPVVMEVYLSSGQWLIAARPVGGWDVVPPRIWELRLLLLLASGLIMVPAIMTGRLIRERQHNISELKDREIQLERLSRRLRLALDTSQIGVWEYRIESSDLFWDDRMNELYRYPADNGKRDYHSWAGRIHPDDLAHAEEDFRIAIETRGTYHSEYRLVLDDGEIRHIRAIGSCYQDAGAPERILGVNWDVTADFLLNEELKSAHKAAEARNNELEATKARIEYNALHDPLTGLPNRRYLDEVLGDHAERYALKQETASLLQVDLDRFKQINDTLGHAAGDAMLVHAAGILRSAVGPEDFVARIGGDEFVIVRRHCSGSDHGAMQALAMLAQRLIERMQRPLIHEDHECRVGISIGIASDTQALADPRRLLVNADIALYRAKAQGRNRYQFFNEALQAEIVSTKRVADNILSGLERDQFVAHFQPQFCAHTLDIIGVEALARWQHPSEGLLAPHAFLPIAEELNVVAGIDRIVLQQTLQHMERWREGGLGIEKASVNVSARRLHDEELISSLRSMDIAPGTISFELVESIFLDEKDDLIDLNVEQVKALGIDVEIDDFGTGYASIVSLMKLRPRRLKIDRQLILPIVRSPAQRKLVGSIIDIGKSLGIEVLAEGVETMAHARILRKLGCDALQGYALARPMDADELADFVRSRSWRKAS